MSVVDRNKGLPLPFPHVCKETDERSVVFCCFVCHMLPENWTNCLNSRKCHLGFWFSVANHDKHTDADEQNHSVLCL